MADVEKHLTPHPSMKIRKATRADLETVVRLGLAAMPMDPQWDYRYPHRLEYPDQHRLSTEERWERFFHPDPGGGSWAVYLVDYRVDCCPKHEKSIPISFSIWHFPPKAAGASVSIRSDQTVSPPSFQSPLCERRQDWDPQRVQAFRKAVGAAQKQKFDSKYGKMQIHLQILGTHPDYQRRGAASLMLDKVIKWARAPKRQIPITVFASPMGRSLYTRFGFEDQGQVDIQIPGEEQSVWVEAMSLEVAK